MKYIKTYMISMFIIYDLGLCLSTKTYKTYKINMITLILEGWKSLLNVN